MAERDAPLTPVLDQLLLSQLAPQAVSALHQVEAVEATTAEASMERDPFAPPCKQNTRWMCRAVTEAGDDWAVIATPVECCKLNT